MSKPRIRVKADVGEGMPNVGAAATAWGGAHHGASRSLKDVAGWNATRGSADADLLPDLPQLTYRARDIRRNNGFAQSIAQTSVDNIVGSGIRLCSQPDYIALGKDKDWADEWGAKCESLFHEYWWSTACHAGDTKTGDMLSEEVMYAKFDNGGSLTLALWLPERGDGFATKLKTVEIDRLSNPGGAPDSKPLRGGIEFDAFGVPLAYYIRRGHPGDNFWQMDMAAMTWERVPRRTPFGRLRVIHDFDGDRADQTRGKPLLSSVLDQFKNIDRYVKAEIQAALMNAMIWGAITTPLEHEEIVELFRGDETGYQEARARHAPVRMQSGTLATLFPGDKLEPFVPQRPAAQFGVFVKNVQSIISVGAGIPYVLAAKDFSESNYSNTRAALLEAWRTFNRRRDRLGAGWLDPILALFLEEMVNAGRIDAPDFYRFRRAYQRCTWIGPGRGYIDKVKEATGDQIMLDRNMTTLQRIAAEQGMHWREMLDQRATEWKYEHETLGLPDNSAIRAANPPPIADDEDLADLTEEQGTEPTPTGKREMARTSVGNGPPKPDPAIAALAHRMEGLEGLITAFAARQAPAPELHIHDGAIRVDQRQEDGESSAAMEPARALIEHEVLELDAAGLPAKTRQTFVMTHPAPESAEPVPIARGTVLKEVVKEVLERDAEGRILRVRETELAL